LHNFAFILFCLLSLLKSLTYCTDTLHRIAVGKLTLLPEEKQKVDLAFGGFTHLDIRLLIATVVSSSCSDEVTKAILQQIESHFSRLCAHQFWLEAHCIISVELGHIRGMHRLMELAAHPK
jgi:hypothetical protein